MKKYHDITQIAFTDSLMKLKVDGKEYEFEIADISDRLAKSTLEEKKQFEISPSGYGIHWPLIDEDLSIDGLLGIAHAPQFQKKIA